LCRDSNPRSNVYPRNCHKYRWYQQLIVRIGMDRSKIYPHDITLYLESYRGAQLKSDQCMVRLGFCVFWVNLFCHGRLGRNDFLGVLGFDFLVDEMGRRCRWVLLCLG